MKILCQHKFMLYLLCIMKLKNDKLFFIYLCFKKNLKHKLEIRNKNRKHESCQIGIKNVSV